FPQGFSISVPIARVFLFRCRQKRYTPSAMQTLQDRLAREDHACFAELSDACADRVHHYLVVHLRSRADADDVLQETFLRVARRFKTLGNVENLEAYVFAIARNEFLRLAATRVRHRREHTPLTGEVLFRAASGSADAH